MGKPIYFLLLSMFVGVLSRKHHLSIKNDERELIALSTFAFDVQGELRINLTRFSYVPQYENGLLPEVANSTFGFTLDKTPSSGISPSMEDVTSCLLKGKERKNSEKDQTISIIYFRLDLKHNPPCLWLERKGKDFEHLSIQAVEPPVVEPASGTTSSDAITDAKERRRRQTTSDAEETIEEHADTEDGKVNNTSKGEANDAQGSGTSANEVSVIDLAKEKEEEGRREEIAGETIPFIPVYIAVDGSISTYFVVHIRHEKEEGLYNFQFHNCANNRLVKNRKHVIVNYTMLISERNGDNYLSAGDIPLPALFFLLCIVYFVLSWIWYFVLKRATEGVFKTHYLMLSFLIVKCLSLLFHSIDYHFIQINGHHGEAFAILYYITYLMKGTLLLVTILLVGAGWSFIKHLLSTREKKLFIVIIPLQILANVAQVIIQETEESTSDYTTWKMIFLMLDLLCCGAILFPVVWTMKLLLKTLGRETNTCSDLWSIKHLQDASQTDGKAAINLQKLKIFRHFYILMVCYIYSTRIITYLLAITLPFRYTWMCVVFKETANLIFFVMTGYKFRPTSENPYLQISLTDDEEEMDEILTETGVTEGLTRVNFRDQEKSTTTTVKQRESSHEYD